MFEDQQGFEDQPVWKHYLLIFREPDKRYTIEFENEFTDMSNHELVSRINVYIPQSFVKSAGVEQFIRLVSRAFERMQRPSCESPNTVLNSLRRLIRRIKLRLYDEYCAIYKNIHGFLKYFFEQLSGLLHEMWVPSKHEYKRKLIYNRLQQHDDLILSASVIS